ncbi:MAG: hypothetical protein RIS22_1163 [Actinomycetota bacterium]
MRLSVAFILSVFLISSTPAIAAPVPKSGSTCKSLGLTQIYQGKIFTCVKSGKKKVWNKGITKKQTQSTQSRANNVPTETPPTQSSTENANSNKKSLTVQEIALATMKKDMKPEKVGNLFRYHYSPNAKQSFKELLESDLNFAMSYWVEVYKNPELFNVFYGTEKDMDRLIESWKPYGFDKNVGFANDFRGRIAREGNFLNAGAVPSQENASHLSILRHSSLPSEPNSFIAHENVHIVQQFLTKNRTGKMPCWLREGSANLFGNFIFTDKSGINLYDQIKQSDMNSYQRGTSGVELRNFKESDWFTHLKSLEGNFQGGCDYINRFAYGSGLLLSELLMAESGFGKMMDFWRAFSLEKDWRISFQEIYGIPLDDWYKTKAIPYVMSEYLRVKPYGNK